MMNVKETLKRLHKKFPMMGLDELFDVLDCYIEEVDFSKTISIQKSWEPDWQPKIWYDYKDTIPLKTNGIEYNKDSISCSTSNKINRLYDDGIAEPSSIQFTASH